MTRPTPSPLPEQLRGLLDIGRALRSGGDLEPVLTAIAAGLLRATGFKAVVINLRRPEWDDFEIVVSLGEEDDAYAALIGATTTWADWGPFLVPRHETAGAYFIPAGTMDWSFDHASYVPDRPASDDPRDWHPEDALLVPLTDSDGELLGIVSVDEPVSGRRPDADQLELVALACAHAAAAIEHAQATAAARRHSAAVEHLLRVSARLGAGRSLDDALREVCAGIRDALGFVRVCVHLPDPETRAIRPRASVGWAPDVLVSQPTARLEDIEALFAPDRLQEGCGLYELEAAHALVPPWMHDLYPSERNGRGPEAWDRHWLVVPLYDRDGAFSGLIWVDDPEDRLLPTPERLQALRAFANQAATAVESAGQLAGMRHLAEHDPLTGLRNRRGFREAIDSHIAGVRAVSLLICDLDNFKRVNDSLGYEAGDEVLAIFSGLLRRCTRDGDVPTRLGGEEFALVLPGAGEADAMAVAERLRRAVSERFAAHPAAVSVSIGVATTGLGLTSASALMRAANRALYAAKHLGRDRCVAAHAETLDMLEAVRESDGSAREQLAAAMLLAETLDLRDVGTARHSETVGRYAEQLARGLGWAPARVARVRAAGILHDIGKLGISDAILHKPGKLDAAEWEEMERHPELGARILEHANLRDIAGWVLAHHERVDGAGYPRGIAADEIPVEARILAVADAYEAMTADRPYRRALPPAVARGELEAGAGTQFDAEIVRAFLASLDGAAAPSPARSAAAPAGAVAAP